ncbi:MAG: DHHA1 domain-containing protein [Candidatus ainarchaeum sp.]|nr:DHHA1 domain-containing protein [Candidatus ainarchaeum sp.]
MQKKILLEKFGDFCRSLSGRDNIAIVYHNDADGISSAAVTAKAVFKLTQKKPVLVYGFNYRDSAKGKIIMKELSKKANKLIIVDLATGYYLEKLSEVNFMDAILIIDHHEFDSDLNSEKIVFVHPKFLSKKNPSSYNASKLCFDVFNGILPLEETDWIACIGIIGDNAKKHWLGFLKKTAKRNKATIGEIEELERLVSAVGVMRKDKFREIFWVLFDAKKIQDCMKKEFLEIKQEFEVEKKRLEESAKAGIENFPELELEIYNIKTDFPTIKSQIVNEISNKKPKKTIIVWSVSGNNARFSARRQDGKVQVNRLLEKAIEGIPNSNAGGHIPAAAGGVPKEFLEKFMEQLFGELKKIYEK